MSIHRAALLGMLSLAALAVAPADRSQGAADKPESVLDRKVVIETQLVTELPKVARLCDSLPVKKQRVNVGDAQLYVEEEGNGVPLVLINGGPGGTHRCFHPWLSRAKTFARVVYYDQRGTGLSDCTPGPSGYSVDQAVADLDAVRAALGIDTWVVLGYSYGEFLAQLYAVAHPDRMMGLVLLGASPGMWTEMMPSRQGEFLQALPPVTSTAVAACQTCVPGWDRQRKASPRYLVRSSGYGRTDMLALAQVYTRDWCDTLADASSFLKAGFAQYEAGRYAEERMTKPFVRIENVEK